MHIHTHVHIHKCTGEVLIKAGAELMARNNVGIMPLHAASLGGHADMGKLLLENGTEIDAKVHMFMFICMHI